MPSSMQKLIVKAVAQHWHKPWHERQCRVIRGVGTQGLKPRASFLVLLWVSLSSNSSLVVRNSNYTGEYHMIHMLQRNENIRNSLFDFPDSYRQPKQQERVSYAKCHSLVWGVLQSLLCRGQAMSSSQAWAPSWTTGDQCNVETEWLGYNLIRMAQVQTGFHFLFNVQPCTTCFDSSMHQVWPLLVCSCMNAVQSPVHCIQSSGTATLHEEGLIVISIRETMNRSVTLGQEVLWKWLRCLTSKSQFK